jgi:tellurite resistance protein
MAKEARGAKAGRRNSDKPAAATAPISAHAGLIYTMVLVSAADREITDRELSSIGQDVLRLPVFEDFDEYRLPAVAAECAELLDSERGLDNALDVIARAVPEKLRETAYALACEVAAADGKVSQEEARILELLRHRLGLGRLVSAAIERGARARAMRL